MDYVCSLPVLMRAGFCTEQAGYHVRRPHGRRDWLVLYTFSGNGVLRWRGQEWRCRAGDVVMLPPGVLHDYRANEEHMPWHFAWAHFSPRKDDLLWLAWVGERRELPRVHLGDRRVRMRVGAAFRRAVSDFKRNDDHADALAYAGLLEALILVARHHAQSINSEIDPRVRRVIDAMSVKPYAPLDRDALAREVALSPSRLSHLFKAQTGESIIQMHMKLRLQEAGRLLVFSDKSVSAVAAEVGFQSVFQFSRQFKLWFGKSPVAYRRQPMAW